MIHIFVKNVYTILNIKNGGSLPFDKDKFKHFKHSHDQNDNFLQFCKKLGICHANEEEKFGITQSIQTVF